MNTHIQIAGEKIVVRGYRTRESVQELIAPLLERYADLVLRGVRILPRDMIAVMEEYPGHFARLAAISCDRSDEWLAGLRPIDGDKLFRAWWDVNTAFLLNCLEQRLAAMAATPASSTVN